MEGEGGLSEVFECAKDRVSKGILLGKEKLGSIEFSRTIEENQSYSETRVLFLDMRV